MTEKFTPDREYIGRMYVEYGLASVDSEYLGDQKVEDLLLDEINRGLDRIVEGKMGNRALSPHRAATEFTMWFTETMWLPFIEDETGNITGPGHQNEEAFARMVNDYDREASGDLDWAEQEHITREDVSHAYATVFEDEMGEVWFKPAASHSPGVVPITTVWGVR